MLNPIEKKRTDIDQFFSELDAGVFAEKIERALSEVAAGVCDHEKKGTVKINLELKLSGNHQVMVEHTLEYSRPTKHGKAGESNTTQTHMHVGKGGRVTLFPENQDQLFDMHGKVNTTKEAK